MKVPRSTRRPRVTTEQRRAFAFLAQRSVTQEPGSNQVNIKYDTILTQEAQGSMNDQRIQQLLLYAARNNYNSGVRMDSVDVLTQAPDDSRVREALMYALQNDTNAGVRLKALDGLSGFVRQDPQVRDGVLRALISDTNSGVRLQALRLVEPMKTDFRRALARLVPVFMPELLFRLGQDGQPVFKDFAAARTSS